MARQFVNRFTVTFESGFCAGHFPGHPIVPAAVQLMWLTDLARAEGIASEGYTVRDLKLLQELSPGTAIRVSLDETPRDWQGSISGEDGSVFARCRLSFESDKPTDA